MSPQTQLDIVAIDDDVAIAAECKTAQKASRRPQFQEEIGKLTLARKAFTDAVRKQHPEGHKRLISLAFFVDKNVFLSVNDRKRAKDAGVTVFDERDLAYYESLTAHLGPGARFQFLADVFHSRDVPGLHMKMPAIRSKMGGRNCYTFAVSPAYLLKIAYVSHRMKGWASDVETYQRMISRSRLKKIRSYIQDGGIFPTNIVVNLDMKPTFHRGSQEADQGEGVMGWLELRPAYKSAWVIDGQHRLFAYSGLPEAEKARVSALAFENLPAEQQAQLFIDINAEQKSVKQSLLVELYAGLHINSPDPLVRVRATIARAVQELDSDPESPFFERIQATEDKRTDIRCVSFYSLVRALNHQELFVAPGKWEGTMSYGPLWKGEDVDATMQRTVHVVSFWFDLVRSAVPEWWDAGAGEGGGLAMNDPVTSCLAVLRSVFDHLRAAGETLSHLDDEELSERVAPYGKALARYLGSLSFADRQRFRDLRGVQGQVARTRRLQNAIHEEIPTFDPPGLQKFLEEERAQTNQRAKEILDRMEKTLQDVILGEIKREHATDPEAWWFVGIPQTIRKKVSIRQEEDDNRRGGKEFYFDLIDYRELMRQHSDMLLPLLGYGRANASKDKRTAWVLELNELRNIVAHPSSGRTVSMEQLEQLQVYDHWLSGQIAGTES